MFHQLLCLKDLSFPNPTSFAGKATWCWYECCDTVLMSCVKGEHPATWAEPSKWDRKHVKCSYGCAAVPHSSRKSFHQGCAVFLSHLSKDCCNSDANARRRPHFTQEASDPLLLIPTRLMQKKKWTHTARADFPGGRPEATQVQLLQVQNLPCASGGPCAESWPHLCPELLGPWSVLSTQEEPPEK